MKKLITSFWVRRTITVLGVFVVCFGVFQAGVYVGFRKASFLHGFGENYYRTFGSSRRGSFRGMGGSLLRDRSSSHIAAGTVLKIDLPTIVFEDQEKTERVARIATSTVIRRYRDTIAATDLAPDDYVVVFGSSNAHSEIEAKLIRIVPRPPRNLPAWTTPILSPRPQY